MKAGYGFHIMRRYERASTMFTSNRPVDERGKLLGDTAAVTGLLDCSRPPGTGQFRTRVDPKMLWWPGHRPTHSFGVCSPSSRRVAPLRPRYAGLSALTTAPRTPVQTGSYRTMPNSDPLHVVVDDLSRFRRSEATVDTTACSITRTCSSAGRAAGAPRSRQPRVGGRSMRSATSSYGTADVSTRCARPRRALRPCRVTRHTPPVPSLRSESRDGPGGPGFTRLRSLRVREPMK